MTSCSPSPLHSSLSLSYPLSLPLSPSLSARQVRRKDALAEEGTFEAKMAEELGGELVRTSKLVGAEKERVRLEELIRRRVKLTGEDIDLKLAEAGFGGQYGGKSEALGGHSAVRFADSSKDEGLFIKGKKTAQWEAGQDDEMKHILAAADGTFTVRVERGAHEYVRSCGTDLALAQAVRDHVYQEMMNANPPQSIKRSMMHVTAA